MEKLYQNISNQGDISFGTQIMPKITSKDWKNSFAIPFVTGNSYNIHWGDGMEFNQINIVPSYVWKTNDKPIILRFNYTTKRETFNVELYRIHKKKYMFEGFSKNLSLDENLKLGSWHHNNISKYFFLGIAGNINGSLIIDRITCKNRCPKNPWEKEKEKDLKKWSDPNIWDNKKLPKEGDNVLIKSQWRMLLDIDETPILNTLIIDGDLIIDSSKETTTVIILYIFY